MIGPAHRDATTLGERVRSLLAAEGRPPSRARVDQWIRAGAVRVDGRTVTDPAQQVAPEARLTLDLAEVDLEEVDLDELEGGQQRRTARGGGAPSATPRPAWLLHADRHLVAVERSAFPPASGPASDGALAAAVAAALAAAGGARLTLWAADDPTAPGSGPVLLGPSAASAARLTRLLREGGARETLLALRLAASARAACGPQEEPADEPDPQPPWPGAGLVVGGEAPPGPPPATARDLPAPPPGLSMQPEVQYSWRRSHRRVSISFKAPMTRVKSAYAWFFWAISS